MTCLEHDHAGTNAHGDDNVHTNGHVSNGEEALHGDRGSERGASGSSTAAGTTVAGASSGGGSNLVRSLSALESGRAGSVGLGGTVGGGLTAEVAGGGSVILVLVVLVHDVAELLEGVAHGIGAVDTGGNVTLDASAGSGVVTADDAEELTVGSGLNVRVRNAGKGVVHALAEALVGGRGESAAGDLPVGSDIRALSGLVGGRVGIKFDGLGLGGEDVGLELVVVLHGLGGVAGNIDETIVVVLLEVHVDDTAREDVSHIIRVKGGGLLEDTAFSTVGDVATVLGEEDGDGVVLEEVDLVLVAGALDGVFTAPLVDVVAPEVDGLALVAAVEIVRHLGTDLSVVVGGIANTHPTVDVARDVVLGVTDSSLDVGRSVGVGGVVGNLVTGEEADDVAVLAHLVDNGGVALVESDVPPGVVAVDGGGGLGQIADDVDTGIVEELHAGAVVGSRVNGVGTDGVGASGGHDGNITLAGGLVGERILEGASGCLATSASSILLVGNTLDEELGAVLVEELAALWNRVWLALEALRGCDGGGMPTFMTMGWREAEAWPARVRPATMAALEETIFAVCQNVD